VSSIYELPIEAYARTTCSFGVANKLHIAFGITFRFFQNESVGDQTHS